jgi:disulfide bond formation protein DsbB
MIQSPKPTDMMKIPLYFGLNGEIAYRKFHSVNKSCLDVLKNGLISPTHPLFLTSDMSCPFENHLSMPFASRILLASSLCALLFVFVMQYGFGLHPCVLCLWQRVPYGVTSALSLLALLWKPYRLHTTVLLGLCSAVYLIGMGLALFHTGVEHHWWLGTSGCAVEPLHGGSPDDIRESLLHTIAPRCDEVVWTVLGFSMANLNILYSLILAFFAAASAAKALQET